MSKYSPFTREQMKNIIDGKCSYERIPMVYSFWSNPTIFKENEERARKYLEDYPSDINFFSICLPDVTIAPEDDKTYRWIYKDVEKELSAGLDAKIYIEDWDDIDNIIKNFPNPNYKGAFKDVPKKDDRYLMANWWYCFFERHWSLRGMENALTDFYLYPDEVHKLYQALTDFYMRLIERCHDEYGADAVFTSDDIGTQNAPFFSEEVFVEFFKPYYKQIIDKAHSLGMHFWLHTCGNIEKFIPHFIEIGLDVIHPIQKYTMDQKEIAQKYGGDICIWAGFDVQQVIPYGTPQEVRDEVRYMIDTYARKDGRLILTCGNGLTSDCPIDSFYALLDESYKYGTEKMK